MKRMMVLLVAVGLCAAAFGELAVSDLKVTPIEPLGLAIDYDVSGAVTNYPLQVSATVGDKTYVAKTLTGERDCENGPHRVYWNMAKDGLTIDASDASVSVEYLSPYCVIDLSNGSSATSYAVAYTNVPSPEVFNTTEYKTTKLVLRLVDPGTFIMGKDQTNESCRVTLTRPFYMGLFEVTQKQWELVMGSNPSYFKTDGARKPVEQVSYNMIRGSVNGVNWPASNEVDGETDGDANDSFLGRLRKRTGLEFDLPMEAQWEYTCRAGTTTTYSCGNSADVDDYMWCDRTEPTVVGAKKANPWGFYGMHGNVCEWCLDWYGSLAYGTDPKGLSSGSDRVLRGGSWRGDAVLTCASSYRGSDSPSDSGWHCGFRLSRTIP